MKKANLVVGIVVLFLFSCNNKTELLCKNWKATAIHNAKMEQQIKDMKALIDTVGTHNDVIKEVVRIDSFKSLLKQNLAMEIEEQKRALDGIAYNFRNDNVVIINTADGIDSAKWTWEEKDFIKIDQPALTGKGDMQMLEVKKLDAKNLTLKMISYGDTSTMDLQAVN